MVGFDLNYNGSTDNEQKLVAWLMMLFYQSRTRRTNFEVQWEEEASLFWPDYRNSFAFGHVRPPGQKYTEFMLDSTGPIAAHRFMAMADAMITPHTMQWSRIKADNKYLMKDRSVQIYYEDLSDALWYQRYRADGNFFCQNQLNWQANGVFGNAGMLVHELDTSPGVYRPGIRYIATSPGEIYILRNYQGRENGHIRHFRWNAHQAVERWGIDKVEPVIRASYEKNDQQLWDFLEFVLPNPEYDPFQIFNYKGKPWSSIYVSVTGYCILERGGYRSYPRAPMGYMRAPEEEYDRGPGGICLPSAKTLNAMKALFLRQGHKAAEPAYLIADDGLVDLKTYPNAYNYGALSAEGAELVKRLETGEIQITLEMMQEEAKAVQDAFLTSFWPILMPAENRPASQNARQVIEESNDRAMFLAPTLGRSYSDYLPTMIDRELDILAYMSIGKNDRERAARHLLPKPPPILAEAEGEYGITYCAPLAKAMQGQGIASYFRMIEEVGNMIQMGADASLMDIFDLDAGLPEIADETFVPARWMASMEKLAAKRQQRQQAIQQDQMVKSLPGRAAMAKAQAVQTKAATGQNIGGVLSGVPAGGMPMMPGQNAPGGRQFGQPGG